MSTSLGDDGWAHPRPRLLPAVESWVVWSDGHDDHGNFIGWCPLHDPQRSSEGSAEFNFHKGVMRCVNGRKGECHPGQRAMSIDNVLKRMGT